MRWKEILVALTCVVATGCYDSRLLYDSGAPPAVDGGPSTDSKPPPPPPPPPPTDQLDLLLMIDNSSSMAEEQASLAAALPELIEELATHYTSMQVGVITSDMGVGGFTVPTCVNRDFGDDGLLRTLGQTADPDCMATYPRFMAWQAGGSLSSADFASQLGCVAVAGNGGCGFEQQLEAVLKALTPSTSPIRFHDDTTGHGDGANSAFVRTDSILATILLTDEEDCSAADPELFDPTSSTYGPTELNLRCFNHPEAVHPVSRFTNGLKALRADPQDVIFAAIAGVPTDLVSDPTAIDYDAILSDGRMIETIDPDMTNRLLPSCNVEGVGVAFPPRRIVQVAQSFGSNGVVQSICQEDYTPVVDAILQRVAVRVSGSCGAP